MSAKKPKPPPERTEATSGPVLNLPTEFPPERLDALVNVLARLLAARAAAAMREETPANENC